MDFNTIITFLACIIILFILGKIFVWPFKSILKLIFNSILGGVLIYIINVIGMNFNFHIGLNLLTSVLVGLLGIPGAVLLIILKIILRIEDQRGSSPMVLSLLIILKNHFAAKKLGAAPFFLLNSYRFCKVSWLINIQSFEF